MLVDGNLTLTYKCPVCGNFEFFSVSLFSLVSKKNLTFKCKCDKSSVKIIEKYGLYNIMVPCILCERIHLHKYKLKDFINKKIIKIRCNYKNFDVCLIGHDKQVRKNIDMLEKKLDSIIDYFGFDNYFENTRVMFDTLNKIHDIGEKNNIFCNCEKIDIVVDLLPDKINISCGKCQNHKIIYAVSNEDLKKTNKLDFIILDNIKFNVVDS
jgi:hypothetical protein